MESFWIVAIVMIVITVVSTILSGLYERSRTHAWREAAARPGMEFQGDGSDILSRCPHLRLFQQGRSQKLRNAVVVQSPDVCLVAGDYRYATGQKDSSARHHTVCVLDCPSLQIPRFFLRPQVRWLDAVGALLGGKDIDIEEDADFSRSFVLQGDDEESVRALFREGLRRWFLEQAARGYQVEAEGTALVLWAPDRRSPQEGLEMMDLALQLRRLLTESMGSAW